MREVCRREGGFIVTGHANYAEYGKDIVCSAVSALLQTFIASVEEFTEDQLTTELTAGYAAVFYKNLSESAEILLDSFFLGVSMIANEYPKYVKMTRRGSHEKLRQNSAGVEH